MTQEATSKDYALGYAEGFNDACKKPTSEIIDDGARIMKPVAWIKIRELSYMKAVSEHGKHDWQTNLGLKPEPDDEGLYTETQVQDLMLSFEQSVTDPENQPSQYGTVLQPTWAGLTDREFEEATHGMEDLEDCWKAIEDALRKKNNA